MSIANSQAMDEGEDDFLRLLGPPPYQIDQQHLMRIFTSYKPRDITVGRLINPPPWIEQAGADSRLYHLFWMYVPLIIPAEALLDPPEEVTGPVSAEFHFLGADEPSELAWDNFMAFIERYFLDPLHSWLADTNTIIFEVPLYWTFEDSIASSQVSVPELYLDNLYNLFATYEELQCYDHPNRLTPLFLWKDSRRNMTWSKRPHTKRNIRSELGISQPMHKMLNQALSLLGRYLTDKVDIPLDQVAFLSQLAPWIRDHIQSLYASDKQKRGYMKYWITNAFDAFSRPEMEMDTDIQS
jgi:hypothetical protein